MLKTKKATDFFSQGFNCAQSVFATFSEKYGLSEELALKIGCGFGGGLRNGELCGAVTGAVMVISLCYGQSSPIDIDSKILCQNKTKEFTDAYKSKNKSIVCRNLLGYDISTPEGMQKAMDKNLFKTTCVDMICSAVKLLEELGY